MAVGSSNRQCIAMALSKSVIYWGSSRWEDTRNMVRRIFIVQRVCKHYMFKFAAAKESWQS